MNHAAQFMGHCFRAMNMQRATGRPVALFTPYVLSGGFS